MKNSWGEYHSGCADSPVEMSQASCGQSQRGRKLHFETAGWQKQVRNSPTTDLMFDTTPQTELLDGNDFKIPMGSVAGAPNTKPLCNVPGWTDMVPCIKKKISL